MTKQRGALLNAEDKVVAAVCRSSKGHQSPLVCAGTRPSVSGGVPSGMEGSRSTWAACFDGQRDPSDAGVWHGGVAAP